MSFQSGGQALNVRSSDNWWQLCILMLIHSCDAIVIDLSKVKAGTEWELNQLRARELRSRCIFVVGDEQLASAQATLEAIYPDETPPAVHAYGPDGRLRDASAFDSELQAVAYTPRPAIKRSITLAEPSWSEDRPFLALFLGALAVIACVALTAGIFYGLYLGANYVLGHFFGVHSTLWNVVAVLAFASLWGLLTRNTQSEASK